MLPKLYHYSRSLITLDRTMVYPRHSSHYVCNKPTGFWVTPKSGNSWREYYRENMFEESGNNRVKVCYRVLLNDAARLRVIRSKKDVDRFQSEYRVPFDSLDDIQKCYLTEEYYQTSGVIDWTRVCNEYDGFLVLNYRKSLHEWDWHETLDCDSGCIWNLKAIRRIKLVGT